jgi:uncharacterized repeat protein (TIGR03803 family)
MTFGEQNRPCGSGSDSGNNHAFTGRETMRITLTPLRRSLHAGVLALAACLLLTLLPPQIQAQTYSVIHNFVGSLDGSEPTSGVTIDNNGNLYGTTFFGDQATGTLYKMSRHNGHWLLTPLYYFTDMQNGVIPYDRPIFGPDGALYLTLGFGGVGPCFTYNNTTGCGALVSLRPQPTFPPTPLTPWRESVLFKFTGGGDGANPYSADIVFDSSGSIYGTTFNGGSASCPSGCGLVYKMTKTSGTWNETVVYSFSGGADGSHPWAGVTFDRAGNMFGTTASGGQFGFGTVYELSPAGSGWTKRTLYSFRGQEDGGLPYSGLIFDQVGNLFGATSTYGTGHGGTVFELSPSGGDWSFTTSYSFSGPAGGFFPGPVANLSFDSRGNLYGTTHLDGLYNFGSVFKLTPTGGGNWTYTSLHDFTAGADGGDPRSNVSFDANGNMYGTASAGGTGNPVQCVGACGVVWQIAP